ncbi:class II aldolase/adducin family protein [Rhodopseudomonas telluris]|uniref:Class II aldolase/adducin family protein n=1 Tax=Rhodopseudomonas telluris TaxID=644215 RepID=A0ABV6EPG1_9BRAD
MRTAINGLSASLGKNPSLVQGPGGNVSWKDGARLHVKASGTWLADALDRDIFVSLSLPDVHARMARGEYAFAVDGGPGQSLRASIETALHALLPHRVVVHVHPVDVIARSVREGAQAAFASLMEGLDWVWIDYAKPGEPLARAMQRASDAMGRAPDVWVLANHGLVVGADDPERAWRVVEEIGSRVAVAPRRAPLQPNLERLRPWLDAGYRLPREPIAHALALDPLATETAQSRWVLYPDQAVFLGGAGLFDPGEGPDARQVHPLGPVVIVPDAGVVVADGVNPACEAMLVCYSEVLLRCGSAEDIVSLTDDEISEIVNWDAEAFRRQIAR